MAYIGKAPGFAVRNRFIYTASSSQTSFSGADDNSRVLKYADSQYVDVYLNGVLLVPVTDYTASSGTTVVLASGAASSDIVEVVTYDIFSIPDTVSASQGGTFTGDVTFTGTVTGAGGALGGGSDQCFFENDTNVTTDYTISTGKNAMSAGPITVDSGVSVTIPTGSVWTIV